MPRIKQFKKQYMAKDFPVWVIGTMRVLGITQKQLAEELGITQPTLSYKLKNCQFEYVELLTIFQTLKADDSTIVRLMKV